MIDYKAVGLKCGVEIHQQLDTGKLFCLCPCKIVSNDEFSKKVERRLRFSLSETGEVDRAAAEEFRKGKYNVYLYNDEVACLVDLDEEPPKGPNKRALDTAVKVGHMLNLKFFDKAQFMRKLIINGSVTSGFQRTAMLGFGGFLKTSFGEVKIEGVNLEEDASRIIEKNDTHSVFSLDRQGIPLIEITTGPQIHTAHQAQEVAGQIGNILRSFSQTKRGLGTIRQDLNVSIKGGARIEIKGAQNLRMIPEIVDAEIRRQQVYLSVLDELKARSIDKSNFSDFKVYDVSKVFEKTTSKVILSNLEGGGTGVFAIRLNGFKGILGVEMQEGYRFATEISDRNKAHFSQIKGLFHSDELPKYGIIEQEVEMVNEELGLGKRDAFILIASKSKVAKDSLKYVLEIVSELILGVPSEVRQVDPKGTKTVFSRPMPGSARMYPETDVVDIDLTKEYLDEMSRDLPELYNEKLDRLKKEFGLEQNRIEEMLSSYSEEQIVNLIKVSGKGASNIYNIVFDIPKDIKKRDGLVPIDFRYELLEDILKEVNSGELNARSIRDLFVSLYKDELDYVENLRSYLKQKGLLIEAIDDSEVEEKIKEIIIKNPGAPFGALMGHAAKEFAGKVEGKKISEILKKLL